MNAAPSVTRIISFVGALLLITGVFGMSANATPAAQASNPNLLSLYLDNPFVQGSYVAAAGGAGVASMNFNGTTGFGRCGDNAPAGVTITGTCQIYTVQGHGGATSLATNATPTVLGSGSNFPSTTNSTDPVIISLTQESRYLGLWWSAGTAGNTMKFYKDSTLLLTVTTQDIMTLLGSAPTNNTDWVSKNNDDIGNVITSVDLTKNRKAWYFGNPRGYASTTPTSISSITTNEPFVYVHMFAGGGLTFNKVELSGGGFEFDNLAVSTTAQAPDPRLILVSETPADPTLKIVQFDSNGSGVQGTMENQIASTQTALRTNTFTRAGYTFDGWNTNPNGVSGTSYANAANYSFAADTTLFAQWQPLTYGIIYDSQGGTEVSDGTYATGSTINLAAAPTRTGFTFRGWFTSSTGGTSLGSTYAPLATGSITLFAQWEPLTYTVSFDTQGGSSVADGTYATDSTITLPQAPTRSGYRFAGWFASSAGGSSLGSSYSPPGTGNITLYAQWTPAPTPTQTPALNSVALASTGSTTAFLLGGFGLATIVGLLMLTQSIRLHRK